MVTLTPQTAVYTTAQVRQLDQIAIQRQGIAGYELMYRAAQAAFENLINYWPNTQTICVICGAGNNAGDGYVLARLAQQAGLEVDVISLSDPHCLQADAQQAYQNYVALGEDAIAYAGTLSSADVYVDALLGTGLSRPHQNTNAIHPTHQHRTIFTSASAAPPNSRSFFVHATHAQIRTTPPLQQLIIRLLCNRHSRGQH